MRILPFVLALRVALLFAPIGAAHANTSCLETDASPSSCQAVLASDQMVPPPAVSDGVRLNNGVTNVLFNNYVCQFVAANSSGYDYFVPQASSTEFSDFLHNPPPGLTLSNCVLPTTFTANSTIPNAEFQIFAEGGAITPVGASDLAPVTNIMVPTNQSAMNGIKPAPNATVVSTVNQSSMQPIQFFYTRQDCANDPYLNPPLCNTWIVRETQTIHFTAPKTSPVGVNSSWIAASSPPVVTSVYDISSNINGPWTPITVNGIPGGTPGIYNNDYMPPALQSCSGVNGTTYLDGQTWVVNVLSTQSPSSAECPNGAGTRVDNMSTPTTYICNNGTATIQSTGAITETGFTGACGSSAVASSCAATVLGGFVGNPDSSNATNQAAFSANFNGFSGAMGQHPAILQHFIDQTWPINQWASIVQGWDVPSWNASGSPSKGVVPDIAMPMTISGDNADADFQAIISGAWDTAINGVFQAWASSGYTAFYLEPGWEMNGSGFPWSVNSSNVGHFVGAFQHIASLAKAFTGAKITVVWAPNVGVSTVNINSYYPGDAYVDIVGLDIYGAPVGVDTTPSDVSTGATDVTLTSAIAFAKAHGKPFSLPETGAADAVFPANLASAIANSGVNVAYLNIWDSNASCSGCRFDGNPQTSQAWVNAFNKISQASAAACSASPGGGSSPQTIYVVDTLNDRVEAFDTTGKFLFQFGSKGSANGQFSDTPWAVRVDQAGNLAVTDDANARVEKFDQNGNYLSTWSGFSQPDMAAQAPNGNVWVTDINGFNANAGSVAVFNAAGTQLFKKTGFNGPAGIAFDASGNAWITSVLSNTIMKLDANGSVVAQFGSPGSGNGQFNFPWSLAFDNTGRIWVADRDNNRIQVFNSAGGYLFQFGSAGSGNGQFQAPIDLAFDRSGNVWVTDMNNNRVQEFDSTGKYLSQFGTKGSGQGQFTTPIGLAIR